MGDVGDETRSLRYRDTWASLQFRRDSVSRRMGVIRVVVAVFDHAPVAIRGWAIRSVRIVSWRFADRRVLCVLPCSLDLDERACIVKVSVERLYRICHAILRPDLRPDRTSTFNLLDVGGC
jgi:hypothetical protein